MKGFVKSHSMAVAHSIFGVFVILAWVLVMVTRNNWFFLLYIPALFALTAWYIYERRWICVCPSCGEKALEKGRRFCPKCGSTTLIRRKLRKICSNGHKIEDEWNRYEKCPKCGEPLQPIQG